MDYTGGLIDPEPDDPRDRRELFHQAFTGERLGAARTGRDDVASMLETIYGTSSRDASRPNVAAAAADLGVHRSTVYRWLKAGRAPDNETFKTLRRKVYRRAAKSHRQSAVRRSSTFNPAFAARGATLKVAGWQGPPDGVGGSYKRDRTSTLVLDANQYQGLFDSYARGGQQAVMDYLGPLYENEYTKHGWEFDNITGLEFDEGPGA